MRNIVYLTYFIRCSNRLQYNFKEFTSCRNL